MRKVIRQVCDMIIDFVYGITDIAYLGMVVGIFLGVVFGFAIATCKIVILLCKIVILLIF